MPLENEILLNYNNMETTCVHNFCLLFLSFRIRYNDWLTSWTTERSVFESRYGKDFYLFHSDQTGSGAHPASYPMGTGGLPQG
jgi:hypothetical protein